MPSYESFNDASTCPSPSASPGAVAKRYSYVNLDIMSILMHHFSKGKSFIYDTVILKMTEKWYRSVLETLCDGSIILDVGIGTGGALLRCSDLIRAKDLYVVGIDIDAAYVKTGKAAVEQAGLSDRVSIDYVNVYEGQEKVIELAKKFGNTSNNDGQFIDAVYFSGSLSLLPDPVKALQLVSTYVKEGHSKDSEKREKCTLRKPIRDKLHSFYHI